MKLLTLSFEDEHMFTIKQQDDDDNCDNVDNDKEDCLEIEIKEEIMNFHQNEDSIEALGQLEKGENKQENSLKRKLKCKPANCKNDAKRVKSKEDAWQKHQEEREQQLLELVNEKFDGLKKDLTKQISTLEKRFSKNLMEIKDILLQKQKLNQQEQPNSQYEQNKLLQIKEILNQKQQPQQQFRQEQCNSRYQQQDKLLQIKEILQQNLQPQQLHYQQEQPNSQYQQDKLLQIRNILEEREQHQNQYNEQNQYEPMWPFKDVLQRKQQQYQQKQPEFHYLQHQQGQQPTFPSLLSNNFSIPKDQISQVDSISQKTQFPPLRKKLPSFHEKLAKYAFLEIKKTFSDDVLKSFTITGKGRHGKLDTEKMELVRQNILDRLGASEEDWEISMWKIQELLRDYRKKLNRSSK